MQLKKLELRQLYIMDCIINLTIVISVYYT